MNVQSLKLVCFSPTGTTKAVIQGIVRGINHGNTEIIDITRLSRTSIKTENDLLVIGLPVYMVSTCTFNGMVTLIKANTPPMYGSICNRAYGDATRTVPVEGFQPIACAAR
jgi:hypothetical protein